MTRNRALLLFQSFMLLNQLFASFRVGGVVNPVGESLHLLIDCTIFRGFQFIFRPRAIKFSFHLPKLHVQFVQIDIGKDRRANSTLRRTAVGFVVLPILDISSFQELSNEIQKFTVLNLLRQQINQYLVVDVVEATRNVAFDKPNDTRKVFLDLAQCRVAAPVRPKPMRVTIEHRLINGFQNHSNSFLQ